MDGLADCALIRHFSPLEDPRIDRQKKHMLIDVVVIAICATLCGGTSFEDFEDFGLEKIKSVRTVNGEASYEDRYFICSFVADAEKFARTVRSHWAVENDLHWRLDILMGKDLSRVRKDHAAENLAAVRRAALNMLRREPTKKSVPRKQKKCALNEAYLTQVLSGRV